MLKNKKINLVYIIFTLFLVISLLNFSGVFNNVDNKLKDYFYQSEKIVSNNIYVVGIDEETLDHYGKFTSFSRTKIAEFIELLNGSDNRPAVIGIDISLFGNESKEIDEYLAGVVGKYDNVVLCSSVTMANVPGEGDVPILYEEPYEELKNSTKHIGFSNLIFDDDGVIRHSVRKIKVDGQDKYSFDEVVYNVYLNSISKKDIELKLNNTFYITYSGKSHAYFGTTGAGSSLYKVLENKYPTEAFKDSIVLLGGYASGMQDNYYTSIESGDQMYGVEIHANIINQMLDGINKKEIGVLEETIIILVLSLLAICLFIFLKEKIAIVLNAVVLVLYVILTKFAYEVLNVILPIFVVVLIGLLIIVVSIIYSYILSEIEKKNLVSSYARYISPELAKKIVTDNENTLTLGGQKKDIAVLFVDIRGFTTLSEKEKPEDIVKILNEYFKITTNAILNNGGMIDKFVGDCTMGLFNAILDSEDYIYKAVCAGLEMIKYSYKLNEFLPEELRNKVSFGVGVHAGEAVVGNIGTDFRMDYTAIGDTVNTASRIEENAKSNQFLVSEHVYELVKERFEFFDAGYLSLKGKDKPMHVYQVIDKI